MYLRDILSLKPRRMASSSDQKAWQPRAPAKRRDYDQRQSAYRGDVRTETYAVCRVV